MCFSEEASFGMAVGLGVIGGATLQKARFSRYVFLAIVPLFLAIQQFSEGLIWLHLEQVIPDSKIYSFFFTYFLFVAVVAWPFWISFALLMAEQNPSKRWILGGFLFIALIMAIYNLKALILEPPMAIPVEHSIRYNVDIPRKMVWLYAILTVSPWFFSSLKGSFLSAIVLAITFFIAGAFYEFAFISVWCFFSTLVSLVIYKIINDNIKE